MSQNNGVVCSFKAMNDKISKLEGLMGSGVIPLTMVEITYSELKSLRDNSQLTPGCWYRITDYETTTGQYNTQSAGHLFDIIVLALDNKTLSEEAWACHSERDAELQGIVASADNNSVKFVRTSNYDGLYEEEFYYAFRSSDIGITIYIKSLEEEPTSSTSFIFLDSEGIPTTINNPFASVVTLSDFASQHGGSIEITDILHGYFSFSKLEAWKLWYCLDNDTTRFMWAKPSDGEKRVEPNFEGPRGRRDEEHDMSEYGLCAWRFADRETYYLYTFNDNPKIGEYFISVAPPLVESASSESITFDGVIYTRNSSYDCEGHFGWKTDSSEYYDLLYTDTENPTTTSTIYDASTSQYIADISWNGKGIIYRMIDEWGNDCPYDFKNIQHILPVNDWIVDGSGTDKPCYTFDQGSRDYSITGEASNNVIGSYCEFGVYKLPVIRMGAGNGNRIGANCNRIYLGAMQGANVCQFVTDVDYQTGGKDEYHHYEWFGRARNGSVVQTNPFGTAT